MSDEPEQETIDVDVDAIAISGTSRSQPRIPLSRERIVLAAIDFIDDSGIAGLSMRRLGKALEVEAMSLYRYVPGREDLLDAVVNAIVDEMYDDPDVIAEPRDGWQDFLQRLAHGVRRMALAHPKAFPLVASRPPEAPWLRPPLRSLRWVELFLDGLIREGFSERAAVASYRAFTSFLLGHLLLEVSTRGADIGQLEVPEDAEPEDAGPGNPGLVGYPRIRTLSRSLSQDHSAAEFEESLENLLDRLTLLRREQ